jgi:hypothetical protein
MTKVTNLDEMRTISNSNLRAYICQKAKEMMVDYGVETLENIGCFVVLEDSEFQMFEVSEMEFVEVLQIENETYLHGVRILSDSYGEDIYLPIEVIECH